MPHFFFWMLVASGFGFLKVITLAQVMAPADFGAYVSVTGVAVLSGTLLSFGQIEGTTKYYPRLWLAGDTTRILQSVRIIITKLTLRFLVAAVLGYGAAIALSVDEPLVVVLSAAGLGLCTAYLALAASLLRAAENALILQSFNLIRNISAALLSVAGGSLLGWHGALVGDVISAALSIVFVFFALRGLLLRAHGNQSDPQIASEEVAKTGGGKLYLSYTLSSSVSMLDRSAVNLALGAAAAGSYGVLALLFQIGQLVVNIFTQRAGPRVIKAAARSGSESGRIESVRKPVLGMALLSLAMVLGALAVKALGFPTDIFAKYAISDLAIVLAGGICFMQLYSLLEFHLIAHDREGEVLYASAVAAGVVAVLFGASILAGLGLEFFLSSMLAARTIHAFLLWRAMNAGSGHR